MNRQLRSPAHVPYPVRRWWWRATLEAVAARRLLGRIGPIAHRIPFRWWCLLGAADSATVVRELAHRSHRPLTFVQVGSNDGISNDPLFDTVRRFGWTGVLVEPLPELFSQLVDNYAGVPGLAFDNVAVGNANGTSQLHLVDPRPGDPEWVNQLASFDREVVLAHRADIGGLDQRIRAVDVESVTLPSLLDRHGIASFDLLHVDAEGFDLEVLDQIDPENPSAPSVVIYEMKHLDPASWRRTMNRFLLAGYRHVNIWPDGLLYRADRLP